MIGHVTEGRGFNTMLSKEAEVTTQAISLQLDSEKLFAWYLQPLICQILYPS